MFRSAVTHAVLFADTYSEYFDPVTRDKPLLLMEVGNVPIVDLILHNLYICEFKTVMIVSSSHADKLETYIYGSSRWGSSPSREVNGRCPCVLDKTEDQVPPSGNEEVVASRRPILEIIFVKTTSPSFLASLRSAIYNFSERQKTAPFLLISSPLITNASMQSIVAQHNYMTHMCSDLTPYLLSVCLNQASDTSPWRPLVSPCTIFRDRTNGFLRKLFVASNSAQMKLNLQDAFETHKSLDISENLNLCGLYLVNPKCVELVLTNDEYADYKSIVAIIANVLDNSSTLRYEIGSYILPTNESCILIDSLRSYRQANKFYLRRYFFPFMPTNNLFFQKNRRTAYKLSTVYNQRRAFTNNAQATSYTLVRDEDTRIASGAILRGTCMVGRSTRISDAADINGSILGPGIFIGIGTHIKDCIIEMDTVVHRDCHFEDCILGERCTVSQGTTLPRGSVVGDAASITPDLVYHSIREFFLVFFSADLQSYIHYVLSKFLVDNQHNGLFSQAEHTRCFLAARKEIGDFLLCRTAALNRETILKFIPPVFISRKQVTRSEIERLEHCREQVNRIFGEWNNLSITIPSMSNPLYTRSLSRGSSSGITPSRQQHSGIPSVDSTPQDQSMQLPIDIVSEKSLDSFIMPFVYNRVDSSTPIERQHATDIYSIYYPNESESPAAPFQTCGHTSADEYIPYSRRLDQIMIPEDYEDDEVEGDDYPSDNENFDMSSSRFTDDTEVADNSAYLRNMERAMGAANKEARTVFTVPAYTVKLCRYYVSLTDNNSGDCSQHEALLKAQKLSLYCFFANGFLFSKHRYDLVSTGPSQKGAYAKDYGLIPLLGYDMMHAVSYVKPFINSQITTTSGQNLAAHVNAINCAVINDVSLTRNVQSSDADLQGAGGPAAPDTSESMLFHSVVAAIIQSAMTDSRYLAYFLNRENHETDIRIHLSSAKLKITNAIKSSGDPQLQMDPSRPVSQIVMCILSIAFFGALEFAGITRDGEPVVPPGLTVDDGGITFTGLAAGACRREWKAIGTDFANAMTFWFQKNRVDNIFIIATEEDGGRLSFLLTLSEFVCVVFKDAISKEAVVAFLLRVLTLLVNMDFLTEDNVREWYESMEHSDDETEKSLERCVIQKFLGFLNADSEYEYTDSSGE